MEVSVKKSSVVIAIALGVLFLIAAACGSKTGTETRGNDVPTGKVIKTVPVGNLIATLSNDSGVLRRGNQEITISLLDLSCKPVEVGAMSLNFHMDQMGTMAAMNDVVTFTTTGTPGGYRWQVAIRGGGEWPGRPDSERAASEG